MSNICEFMQYKNDEDSPCTASACIECNIYKALIKQIPQKVEAIKLTNKLKLENTVFGEGCTIYKCK